MSTAIVWFRRDLRLADNPALDAALAAHARVLPLYIHAPDEEAPWEPGAASRWWLHHSLAALADDLARRGARLHIARGASLDVLQALAHATGADAVYWNRLYEPAIVARDKRVKHELRAQGTAAHSHNGAMFAEPWEIETGQGGPYRVFTPYWRKLRATLEPRTPLPAPARIDAPALAGSLALDALGLLPRIPWDTGFHENWTPGEAGAHAALADFCGDGLVDYATDRDRPDLPGTSRLSPHLHFGEISPRQIHWQLDAYARDAGGRTQGLRAAAEPYLRELGWRDFSLHLLYHFPHTPERNLNPAFDAFPWAPRDDDALAAWRRGRTGVPIVDAGMRELWHTGWMHNRVRMVVASFLTKNLRQHWSHGARWFWDTLVDADLANNTQGWQWTAGTGADASPYFRIFNPVSQGERFDPDGSYVRRWVPELARFPAKLVHEPWKDATLLARSGYPEPVVDLKESREAALEAYQAMKG
ncbi:cryptochrome/photolyase family protein [Tahibacter soli]|uniref:Deoxyribodipyrimidine photo-lyase n=1 Tax=Tahibacter soli TaxID=2983605 RepID=A0A9X3YRT6_9GAMM|nr:deoxyribodipyrimidine photo-lyase [Tahibacter soli]MDC8015196.1 deoxyribodipyrimidine photo-lyase [Tahibacter soli]